MKQSETSASLILPNWWAGSQKSSHVSVTQKPPLPDAEPRGSSRRQEGGQGERDALAARQGSRQVFLFLKWTALPKLLESWAARWRKWHVSSLHLRYPVSLRDETIAVGSSVHTCRSPVLSMAVWEGSARCRSFCFRTRAMVLCFSFTATRRSSKRLSLAWFPTLRIIHYHVQTLQQKILIYYFFFDLLL